MAADPQRAAEEFAPAKVNLALHVTGRRADGYHLLDSLVCCPETGDRLFAEEAEALSLRVEGPFGESLAAESDNLVLRAARLLGERGASLLLRKELPVASGIGGGSADAAAALRLLTRFWKVPLPAREAVVALGADVPVCLESCPARMRGIGEVLEPARLPAFSLVLVNPGVPVATAEVFGRLVRRENAPLPDLPVDVHVETLVGWLRETRNDLEEPAVATAPVIAQVLAALRGQGGCAFARMSGSGATCFGLFPRDEDAGAAAVALAREAPGWWVRAAPVRTRRMRVHA